MYMSLAFNLLNCHILNIGLIYEIGLSYVEHGIDIWNWIVICWIWDWYMCLDCHMLIWIGICLLDWFMFDWFVICPIDLIYVRWYWFMFRLKGYMFGLLWIGLIFRYLTKYLMYLPPLPSLFPNISGWSINSSVPVFRRSDQQQHKPSMLLFVSPSGG